MLTCTADADEGVCIDTGICHRGDCKLLSTHAGGYSTNHVHLGILAVKQCSLKKVEDQLLLT